MKNFDGIGRILIYGGIIIMALGTLIFMTYGLLTQAWWPLGLFVGVTAGGAVTFVVIQNPIFRYVAISAAIVIGLLVVVSVFSQTTQIVIEGWEAKKAEWEAQKQEKFYIWPADGSAETQKEWVGEKYVPDLGEATGETIGVAYCIGIIAFIAMILLKGHVPLQILFAAGWAAAAIIGIGTPLGIEDPKTAEAASLLWWWGATQAIIWGLLLNAIPLMLAMGGKGAQDLAGFVRHPIPVIIFSGLTWGITAIIFPVFDPGFISWTMAQSLVHETQLSSTHAMELIMSGKVAFIAVAGAVRAIVSIIEKG